LKSATDAIAEIGDLSGAIIASGRGGQAAEIRSAIDAGAPGLSGEQKVSFYERYSTANPTASPDQFRAAAKSANTAGLLGRDVGNFAGLQGSLERSGVKDSADLANYLMTYAPDAADKAGATIAKAPGQATQIAEAYATAYRGGKGTMSLIDRASNQFAAGGGRGDFASRINAQSAGPGGMDDLAYMNDPRNRAPGFRAGGLDEAMRLAAKDPDLAARIASTVIGESAQDDAYNNAGGAARRKMVGGAVANKLDSQGSLVGNLVRNYGWMGGIVTPGGLDAAQFTKSRFFLENIASTDDLSTKYLKDISDKVTAPVVAPRFRRHGEESR
jgi:hypothetical protein